MKQPFDRNVIVTGVTSFFTDVSTEMVYPLLQAFIKVIMASRSAFVGPALGIIEGVSESTASLLKAFAGYYSDRISNRKLPVIAGYGLSALSKLLLLAANAGWQFVLFARFFDRVGKGIRTAPRDALIAESTASDIQGKAFGFQRSMDFAGAFCGVLICWFLIRHFIDPATASLNNIGLFYRIFLISVVPAFIGVAVLFLLREKTPARALSKKEKNAGPDFDIRNYDANLRVFFLVQLLFTLGNSSNQFLLLRSMDLGFSLSSVVLMYMLFNLTSSALGTLFGSLSDTLGRKPVVASGYALYSLVYGAFGFVTNGTHYLLWGFWVLYGVFYALTEGVEKALVAELAPGGSKATALGLSNMIVGIGLLPASLIAGTLFAAAPSAPFIFGSAMSLSAFFVLVFFLKKQPAPPSTAG